MTARNALTHRVQYIMLIGKNMRSQLDILPQPQPDERAWRTRDAASMSLGAIARRIGLEPPRHGWWNDAACGPMPDTAMPKNDGIFFPDRGSRGAVNRARIVCGQCLVKDACLVDAMLGEFSKGEYHGTYGGLSPKERKQMSRDIRSGEEPEAIHSYIADRRAKGLSRATNAYRGDKSKGNLTIRSLLAQ